MVTTTITELVTLTNRRLSLPTHHHFFHFTSFSSIQHSKAAQFAFYLRFRQVESPGIGRVNRT
jgi:hypothetical protein